MTQAARYAFAPIERANENTFKLNLVPIDAPEWTDDVVTLIRTTTDEGESWTAFPGNFNAAEFDAMILVAQDLMEEGE